MIKKGDAKTPATKPMNPNKILIENFVALQKVLTNLSVKFDNLSTQISKLLELFEISAKALAEKEFHAEKGDKSSRKIMEKIDTLLEQNKTIARGLTLIHEREEEIPPVQRFPKEQIPSFPSRKPMNYKDMQEFQKSISDKKENA